MASGTVSVRTSGDETVHRHGRCPSESITESSFGPPHDAGRDPCFDHPTVEGPDGVDEVGCGRSTQVSEVGRSVRVRTGSGEGGGVREGTPQEHETREDVPGMTEGPGDLTGTGQTDGGRHGPRDTGVGSGDGV